MDENKKDPKKSLGLFARYYVQKLSNPNKKIDAVVLEFDDPVARVGILAFAQECNSRGYSTLYADLLLRLNDHETLDLINEALRAVSKLREEKGFSFCSNTYYDQVVKTRDELYKKLSTPLQPLQSPAN